MSRTIKLFLFLGMVLSLALVACGPQTTLEPAPVEPTAPPAGEPAAEEPAEEMPVALQVTGDVANEQAWTEDEVKAMDAIDVESTNSKGEASTYTGVLLSDLISAAEPSADANLVTFVADDGYSAEIGLEELMACADCIASFRNNGGFSTVLPGYEGKLQVKGVIEIQIGVGEMAAPEPPDNTNIILATTTSTQDSGLLDVLVPMFEEQTGYVVQTVAVGTGAALAMGQEGNADVLLVHAPASEIPLMESGDCKDRFLVMHNDFVIVGPAADPAGIKGNAVAADAFGMIAAAEASFVSRGDDSGTNKKELSIWGDTDYDPNTDKPAWYVESGQGMGATLVIASETQAYTMTDRATYLANQENLDLEILVEGDAILLNVYHVMTVNPEKWELVNYDGGLAFANFMIDPATQDVIREFGVAEFGQPLFFPDADKTDADLGL
ncbi:MAG: substrate-binding domain-containing protein [Anaerolineales bacterium]|jgi:tungstate transport system substrate-binding protein